MRFADCVKICILRPCKGQTRIYPLIGLTEGEVYNQCRGAIGRPAQFGMLHAAYRLFGVDLLPGNREWYHRMYGMRVQV